MNSSGFIRGLMAKNFDNERFLLHVAECIERQLKEWDENYEVMVAKMPDYFFVIRNAKKSIYFTITEKKAKELQEEFIFALDRHIWLELQKQGVKLQNGQGNYLSYVFSGEIPDAVDENSD